MRIRNATDHSRERWLEYDNAMAHTLQLFIFNETGEEIARHHDGYASNDPEILLGRTWPMFRLVVPANTERTILLRIRTPFSIRANLRLLTAGQMQTKMLLRMLGHGVFYGIAGLAIVFLLAALVKLRQPIFGSLVAASLMHVVFYSSHDGIYYGYRALLPFDHESITLALVSCAPFANVFVLFFLADLLDISKKNTPRLFATVVVFAVTFTLIGVLFLFHVHLAVLTFQISLTIAVLIFFSAHNSFLASRATSYAVYFFSHLYRP